MPLKRRRKGISVYSGFLSKEWRCRGSGDRVGRIFELKVILVHHPSANSREGVLVDFQGDVCGDGLNDETFKIGGKMDAERGGVDKRW